MPTNRLTVKAYRRDDMLTPIAEFPRASKKRFTQRLSEPGEGSFELPRSDGDVLKSLGQGAVITFSDDREGEVYTPLFTMVPEEIVEVMVDQGEASAERVTVSGPGLLSVLSEALVYPPHGIAEPFFPLERSRAFNYTATDYTERTGWLAAGAYGNVSAGTAPWTGVTGWPEATAQWIWSPTSVVANPKSTAPVGSVYFRHRFLFNTRADVILYAACDNAADVYLNGQHVLTTPEFTNSPNDIGKVEFRLSAGTHTLAVHARNHAPAGPAGLAVALTLANGAISQASGSHWRALSYPATFPGMTVNEILSRLVTEAKVRGCFPDLNTIGIDNLLQDNEGAAWPFIDVAFDVGTDLLAVLDALTGTHCDAYMSPGGWPITEGWFLATRLAGRMGGDSSVSIETPSGERDPQGKGRAVATTGNLTSLEYTHRR